jgi:hypothetical protein
LLHALFVFILVDGVGEAWFIDDDRVYDITFDGLGQNA